MVVFALLRFSIAKVYSEYQTVAYRIESVTLKAIFSYPCFIHAISFVATLIGFTTITVRKRVLANDPPFLRNAAAVSHLSTLPHSDITA